MDHDLGKDLEGSDRGITEVASQYEIGRNEQTQGEQ
jgi:hypothetical protein